MNTKRIIGKALWVASEMLDEVLDVAEAAAGRADDRLSCFCIYLASQAVRLGYDGRSGRHERGDA